MLMNLEEIWLAHFKEIVDKEAQEAGSLRAGYRAVATRLGRSEEYIYQIYQRKPKSDGAPRPITLAFAKAIAKHYANDRSPDWINTLPSERQHIAQDTGASADSCAIMPINTWPFKQVTYKRFMDLPRQARLEIDAYLDGMVSTWEKKNIDNGKHRKHS